MKPIKLTFILLITALNCQQSSANNQTLDWVKVPGTFKKYLNSNQSMTFADARKYCFKKRGQLPQVNSKQENSFLTSLIPTTPNHDWKYAWMNAKKAPKLVDAKNANGGVEWIWFDGQDFTFTNFKTNLNPYYDWDGVALREDGVWVHKNYNALYYVICEKPDLVAMLQHLKDTIQVAKLDIVNEVVKRGKEKDEEMKRMAKEHDEQLEEEAIYGRAILFVLSLQSCALFSWFYMVRKRMTFKRPGDRETINPVNGITTS